MLAHSSKQWGPCCSVALADISCSVRSGTAQPAWLKICLRPPPFPFPDTRRRSSLIAYRSLRHLTVTHTQAHTHTEGWVKKHTPQLHRWGGAGDTGTRWDLFPNAHRWRCEAFAGEVRTALWICEPLYFCICSLSGYRLRGNEYSNGLLRLPTFTPVNPVVCVGRTIPNSADVSTASKQPVGFWKSLNYCVAWMVT